MGAERERQNSNRARVEVLRLGHRPDRDKRITTHVALVSRAFGASGIHVDTKDTRLEQTIASVNDQFGGDFSINTGISPRSIMNHFRGTIVHLTMYGEEVDRVIEDIPEGEDLLIIIGSEKVPREVFDLAHFNVSVSNQPHSEVSALAIFLDRYFKGAQFEMDFPGGEIIILPDGRGKTVKQGDDAILDPKRNGLMDRSWSEVPDPDECLEILSSAGCSTVVIKHSRVVYDLGMEMVRRSEKASGSAVKDIDIARLSAGLLLHDLGRSRTHSIRHAVIGAELAEMIGLHPGVVAMIRNHVGGGLPAAEAIELGLPEVDLIPLTWEEKLVSHADTLVGNLRRRSLDRAVQRLEKEGADKGVKRIIALHA
ncbi:MAG: HDIG domain-containing protein, partial [Thermoplasmata archaeon]|nr:HDIG domain-containing protein [Thermoplasmata archaeon]